MPEAMARHAGNAWRGTRETLGAARLTHLWKRVVCARFRLSRRLFWVFTRTCGKKSPPISDKQTNALVKTSILLYRFIGNLGKGGLSCRELRLMKLSARVAVCAPTHVPRAFWSSMLSASRRRVITPLIASMNPSAPDVRIVQRCALMLPSRWRGDCNGRKSPYER